MRPLLCTWLLLVSASMGRAQVIGIDDLSLTGNAALGLLGSVGQTSLHIYSASALRDRGVCTGATLQDLQVVPITGAGGALAGTFSAPTALVQLGHVAPGPLQPLGWGSNLQSPLTIHGLASGPYTFAWAAGTFVPLPGFGSSGFVWDGVRDIGVLISVPAATTGGFVARASGQRRVFSTVFPPGTGSIVDGVGALKVRLTFAPGLPCASATTVGNGCYDQRASFYEAFVNAATFDLAGSSSAATVIRATPTPNGYAIAAAPSAWRAPSGGRLGQNSLPLSPMAWNTFSVPIALPFSFPFVGGSTNVIHAASSGFVLLAATGSPSPEPNPTISALLTGEPRLAPLWMHLDPLANSFSNPAAGVFFELDPNNQAAYVTWNDCSEALAAATSINLQCVLRSNGEFEFRYLTCTLSPQATNALVGWSRGSANGRPALDPGPLDLSAALPFNVAADAEKLRLRGNPPSFANPWQLVISEVPPLLPLGFLVFGTTPLAGPDLGAIGAPGCRAYSSADITAVTLPATNGVASGTTSVPSNPVLIGTAFVGQAMALSPLNALGLITSNGIHFVVGN